ncbi:MAG: DNA-formamidopyrimidine glycosylase family protein, partial [Bdellovibrionales bacterium]
HGKYLQLYLSNDQTIVWHMGMSGSVKIYQNKKEQYTEQKHDHVVLETSADAKIVFNDPRRFGMFYTLPSHEINHYAPFSQMGPDAMACTEAA